jgi:hypothetical protein
MEEGTAESTSPSLMDKAALWPGRERGREGGREGGREEGPRTELKREDGGNEGGRAGGREGGNVPGIITWSTIPYSTLSSAER